METIQINYEIKNSDKTGETLKESFINNCLASFGKSLIDLIMSGYDIRISELIFKELPIQSMIDVEVIDPDTKEITIVQESTIKDCYVGIAKIFFQGSKSESDKHYTFTTEIENGVIKVNKHKKVRSDKNKEDAPVASPPPGAKETEITIPKKEKPFIGDEPKKEEIKKEKSIGE